MFLKDIAYIQHRLEKLKIIRWFLSNTVVRFTPYFTIIFKPIWMKLCYKFLLLETEFHNCSLFYFIVKKSKT